MPTTETFKFDSIKVSPWQCDKVGNDEIHCCHVDTLEGKPTKSCIESPASIVFAGMQHPSEVRVKKGFKVACNPPNDYMKGNGYQKMCEWIDDESPAGARSRAKIL